MSVAKRNKDEQNVELRKQYLEQFYEKVIKESQRNDAECYFYEIPDYSILDTSNNTFLNTNLEFVNIIQVIESKLKSKLKKYLIRRSASKILENKEYQHWHDKSKDEIKRLKNFLTKKQLKEYLFFCYHDYNKVEIASFMNIWMQSDLQELLIKRESLRDKPQQLLLNRQNIYNEWVRLTNILPLEYVVCYALEATKSV